jgi:hypothetical protein
MRLLLLQAASPFAFVDFEASMKQHLSVFLAFQTMARRLLCPLWS